MSEKATEKGIFLTKKRFGKMVEETVKGKNMSYMDAIIWLCGENRIELEDVARHLTPVIKAKLEYEGMELNMLPRKNTL